MSKVISVTDDVAARLDFRRKSYDDLNPRTYNEIILEALNPGGGHTVMVEYTKLLEALVRAYIVIAEDRDRCLAALALIRNRFPKQPLPDGELFQEAELEAKAKARVEDMLKGA